MAKSRARLTGFARFLIFLLIAAPISFMVASYANGEDGVKNISKIIEEGKEKITYIFGSKSANTSSTSTTMSTPFLGLRTTIYKVSDLEAAKKWYTTAFETAPYFDEPYYVGFNIAGFELGLQPSEQTILTSAENVLSYWGVENIQEEFERLLTLGATVHERPQNVGGPIKVATVKDPWGNVIGLIYNPEFKQ